jgi:hypothetical protein
MLSILEKSSNNLSKRDVRDNRKETKQKQKIYKWFLEAKGM